jgi:hypothetical protein
MERLTDIRERDITLESFQRFPIWTWDDSEEGYHPVVGNGEYPDECPVLFIAAEFTLSSGQQLPGYLIGRDTFFAFGLFVGATEFVFNRNLPDSLASGSQFLSERYGNVFPICYRAVVPWPVAIEGKFQWI